MRSPLPAPSAIIHPVARQRLGRSPSLRSVGDRRRWRTQPSLPVTATRRRSGFTLVEILVATVLTLLMMLTVVTVFGNVSDSVSGNRTLLDQTDQLRFTKDTLQRDLAGITVTMNPPRRPEQGEGYFEYIEGPVSAVIPAMSMDTDRWERRVPVFDTSGDGNLDEDDVDPPQVDSTVGDYDDILMFTTRSLDEPFVGRFNGGTIESRVAEVAWFMRGSTLYRRVLLVLPGVEDRIPTDALTGTGAFAGRNFYEDFDLSVRVEGGNLDRRAGAGTPRLRLNTLGDLTKRENRYAHQPFAYPHDARIWGDLGLPTLVECSSRFSDDAPISRVWPLPFPYSTPGAPIAGSVWRDSHIYGADPHSKIVLPNGVESSLTENVVDNLTVTAKLHLAISTGSPMRDMWLESRPWLLTQADDWPATERQRLEGNLTRYQNQVVPRMDDVILTNVLSFDVKVWDPGAPVFSRTSNDNSVTTASRQGDLNYRHLDGISDFFTTAYNATATSNPIAYGAYVDLNYLGGTGLDPGNANHYPRNLPDFLPRSHFWHPGDPRSRLSGIPADVVLTTNEYLNPLAAAVYDTGSFHYEHDGFDQDLYGTIDQGTDGFDNDGVGGVDDAGELEAPPPYAVPLRGIQVKIRVFDPRSRQVREVTVVQEFNAR